jgi:hypothetical protein
MCAEGEEASPRGAAKHEAKTAPSRHEDENERHHSEQPSINPLTVHGLEHILRVAPRSL